MSAKRKKVAVPESIHDSDVSAPDALTISGGMRNEKEIAAWWERVKLYAQAMHALDRAVLIKHIADEDIYYLSSVPDASR